MAAAADPRPAERLRLSAFPVIGDGPDARAWEPLPPATVVASHCWGGDSEEAVHDGRVPRGSGDHSLPRFTWWDHRGTAEWLESRFEAKVVSRCEVYWFDDTGRGYCRVPASWRIEYRDGETWRPVTARGASGVDLDTFNTVEFEPVTTTALRLVVQLQPGFSGGILEWRIR